MAKSSRRGHDHTGDIHKHVGHHLPAHPGRDQHAHASYHEANKAHGMGRGCSGSGDNDGDSGVHGGIGSPGGAGMASNVKYGK